jgi:TgpA N-terminal domain/Transglutaminase-like superfamily/Domain of unknown function (DUF4129)
VTLNGRMTVTTAIAVVLTSTVLYPMFTDSVWFAASLGAVAAVAATGALTRLRPLPVPACLAATLAGLLLYLNLIFEARHSLAFVIPTPSSLASLARLFGTGISKSNQYAPPVPNLPGLLLLAAAGVGITAVVTDLIAVRLRSTALAGLPLLLLFTLPVMINPPHGQLTTPLVFCLGGAGYLAMLSVDGRERIRVWGRLVSLWRGAPSPGGRLSGPDTRALAAASRRVGLASIVLALCVPLLLPGLHASKLFSSGPGIGGTGGDGPGALTLPSALSQAVAQLHDNNPKVVFTYTTSASKDLQSNDAQYFRQYVFDTLGASGWQVVNYTTGAAPVGSLPRPQGLTDLSAAQLVNTTISVTKDFPAPGGQPTFLPLPYPAVRVSAPGRWLADPDLMVYSTVSAIGGQTYAAQSLAVDPSEAQLEKAPGLTGLASLEADRQLPSSYQTPALKQLALQHVSGDTTELAKVNALANWLSEPPFVYSLNSATFGNADGLLAFLTQSRAGYCVQYAYAMTVLTRLLGIPARFVVGYTAGTRVSSRSNTYEVRNTDAHAWTEVYFRGYGWIRFEPTPGGQGTASSPNYMGGASGLSSGTGTSPILPATQGPGHSTTGQAGDSFGLGHLKPGSTGGAPAVSGLAAGTPWAAIALAVIAAIVLACAVIAIVAPPAQRALFSGAAAARRRPVTGTSLVLVAAAAALVALALYRLLSRTAGLDLGAGWATVGIAFAVAGAVMLTAPSVLRITLRHWRWIRAGDDAGRAHAAWREFHDDLADFGLASRPSEPPRTLAVRITARLPADAADAVRRLALAEERASYAARPAGSAHLRRDGIQARRGLAATARRGARWRARLFPASAITILADSATRIPDRATTAITRKRAPHRSPS